MILLQALVAFFDKHISADPTIAAKAASWNAGQCA
jgi:hypothetical protein